MSFIDSHAHVDAPEFDDDREAVLSRARDAGVEAIVVIGAGGSLAVCERAVDLADSSPDLYATVGVHPHDAAKLGDSWWPRLRQLGALESVVAIGETGLDYHYDLSPRDVQQARFREHVRLARELCKPVVCHIRDAHDDARDILDSEGADLCGAVIHCFTGTAGDARGYAERGFGVSFSGIATFKSAGEIRRAIKEVPLGQLLIETDCPYLAPVPMRGRRNEPSFLVHTASVVAREAGVSLDELGALTTANTRRYLALT